MSEMKKCPFCGEHATEIATCMQLEECAHFEECPAAEPYVCMVCSIDKGGCGASTGYYDSAEKASEAWNRRAQTENARQHTLQTGVCPMCEDCPDGCPIETPHDSRNRQENERLVRCKDCVWWKGRQVQLADGTCRDYLPDEPWSVTIDVGINVGSHCTKHGFEDKSGSWFWATEDDFCSRGVRKPERSEG